MEHCSAYSSINDSVEVVDALMEAGASVSAVDVGMAPLIGAANVGHVEVARLLCAGAPTSKLQIQAVEHRSSGPPVLRKSLEILNLQIQLGAELDHRAEKGATALMYAAMLDNTGLQASLAAGANPKIKNDDGQTAADHAVVYWHPEIAALVGSRGR